MPFLLGTRPGIHYKSLKTVYQSLKHKVNRRVLSLRLNECKLSASRTAAGRLFHTTGPATMCFFISSTQICSEIDKHRAGVNGNKSRCTH